MSDEILIKNPSPFGGLSEPSTPVEMEIHAQIGRILERISDAFIALDVDWRYTYVNQKAAEISGRRREDMIGRHIWTEFPHSIGQPFYHAYHRAMADQTPLEIEEYYPPYDRWFENRIYPSKDGLSIFFQDVTSRKRAEEALWASEQFSQAALNGLSAGIAIIDGEGTILAVNQAWRRFAAENPPVPHNIAEGANYLRVCDQAVGEEAEEARQVAVGIRSVAAGERELFTWEYPCHSPQERRWFNLRATRFPGDGQARVVVSHENITDRVQAEAEQTRLANANRLLLDSTGEGIYGVDAGGRFTFVNRAAAQILGYSQEGMLGCDGHALIHHSHPDGAPYPEGDCPISQTMQSTRGIHVENEAFWRKDHTPIPVAYSAAPIMEEGVVRGVVVTFSDISDRKALEAERERLAEREHNIASQLQAALQPKLPATVPGLAVTKYYEAAQTEEAGVGGDFYDVFALEKDRTALVVGDLSGKGLQAAAQVSIVRNMLRAFLYSKSTLAEAVTELNRVLAEKNLLTGFSTLFVGVYNSSARVLNYVNCGQEPCLVRRATSGQVEELAATGPILGCFKGASFAEQVAVLATGDALAIYSDGLTEVGRSRKAMLGVEGIIALFGQAVRDERAMDASELAECLALRLIAGVDDAAAGGVMRDDVCLLVGVVE